MTDLQTTPTDRATDADELCHYCCCHDENVALCTTDLSGCALDSSCSVDCLVCVDLERTESCPRFGRCVLAS